MQKLLYLLLIVSTTIYGQATTDQLKPSISNTKTPSHINIPGTRLYIVPPPGFVVAKGFIGLQKGEQAMMNIYDLVGGNFYTNAATFSKAEFEAKGAKVFDYQEIKVNGFPAKYISMQGDPNAKVYSLVFGDTTFSLMIMCVYPAGDPATGSALIRSLNSIYYDKAKKINAFATANFSLDEKVSTFRFNQYNANMYVYTIGGVDQTGVEGAPVVLVTNFPKDNTMTLKSIAEGMVAKLQQYGLTSFSVKNTSTDKINGFDTYQMEVRGDMKGKPCVIYYCVVGKADKAIVFQGMTSNNLDKNLQEFKKLAATLKLK